ncbi:MAG: RHS repeat-associated core domain-containing protein [Chloracidobacterium sp.]|nr:RHS repeat-associated core domain-containing protein [Chloracidobacterium sp.]
MISRREFEWQRTTLSQFDILGRVTGHKQTTDGTNYTTGYTYNLAGALIEEMYPSGRVVKNVLDNTGDLSIVQSKKNSAAGYWNYADAFTYNAAGAVTSMQLGNGRWESTAFNSRLQPTEIKLGTTPGTHDKLKLEFAYGTTANNGNVLSQTISVPTVGTNTGFTAVQTYSYDSLNRLKDATENLTPNGGSQTQSWKQTFTFDRYGNRRFDFTSGNTTVPASSCTEAICNPTISTSNNRLTSTGWLYDNTGNTTRDGNYQTFTYDAENKQVEVKNSSSVTLGQYWYDGDGKRVKKVVPSTGEVTIFVYDAAGKQIAEYSTVVESVEDAKVAYLTADHLGSPRVNTDRDGKVTSRHDYHPFGEEIITTQRTSHTEYTPDSVRKQFTGYERDYEASLDFAEARYYGYNHGRFTSVDPIMMTKKRLLDPQSINLYVYTRNNPLKYIDPSGEEFKGTDGKKVLFEEKDGQIVILSANATKDIIKLVGLINTSGSSTALSQFNKLNAHKTMVNLTIDPKRNNTFLYGLHQPHGTRPDGSKGALTYNPDTDKFEGTPDIAKDANGNEVYAEATITLFEGELSNAVKNDRNELETQMVGIFVHEAEHDLDPNQVQMAKTGKGDHRSWHPEKLYKLQNDTIREIREFRNRPKCPRGHMCF